MCVMVVAMMEMRLHAESIQSPGDVGQYVSGKLLAIFCVDGIEILDEADWADLIGFSLSAKSVCGCNSQKSELAYLWVVSLPIRNTGSAYSGESFSGAIIGSIHGPALWHQARSV
jgi:hypothetical protein